MNPQVLQALMQTLQQAMQILQQAGGDPNLQQAADPSQQMPGQQPPQMPGQPPANPMDQGEDGMDDEPDDDEMPTSEADDDMGDDSDMDDDDEEDDMGGGSIHDRVSALENHTGLKKSARNQPLTERVADLEEYWLGEEWEGPISARVRQLEKTARVKPESVKRSPAPQPEADDTAPDEIPLDALIKTAIQEGIKQGIEQILNSDESDDLPSIASMRKAAKGQARFGERRSQAPIVPADEDLLKAAGVFGYGEDDLDNPVSFGDVLLMQYHASLNGAGAIDEDD